MLKHLVIALTLLQTVAWSAPIYIVGSITEGLNSTPTLWIAQTTSLQSQPVAITLGAPSENATANAVVSVGNTIYSVGRHGQNKNAMLWITDVPSTQTTNPLIFRKPLSPEESEALGIIAVGNRLFIIGYINQSGSSKATLWITNTTGNVEKEINLSNDTSVANSIIRHKKEVYIVGYNTAAQSNKPLLWITNLKDSKSQQFSLDTTDNGVATSIAVTNNQLYCLGYNATKDNAQAWITDLSGNIQKKNVVGTQSSFGYCCINIKNKIYDLMSAPPGTFSLDSPLITLFNTSGDPYTRACESPIVTAGGFIKGTSSMVSSGNKLYVVGYLYLPTGNVAVIWEQDSDMQIQGTGYIIQSYVINNASSIANGIFIPQGSQLLPAAIKSQTTSYQRGL